ncbi:MAG: transposase [Zhengella sp.]|uniref:IS110 family transposase n=1 Tax=Zhengella sp. TaxID=2282762 RepID=UPI0035286CDB
MKVNPLQARRFAQARGTRAKTDAVDAHVLALMGEALDLQPDSPASEDHHDLKQLQVARTAMIKARTRLKNRLATQTLSLLRRQAKVQLALLDRQLKAIDAEIASRLSRDQARSSTSCNPFPASGPLLQPPSSSSARKSARWTANKPQPCRARPDDPTIGPMARQGLHSGWP